MTIRQERADDSVLRLRVGALLQYIGGLMQDRTYKELPEDLAAIKGAVDEFTHHGHMVEQDTVSPDRGTHTYYIVEALSQTPMFVDDVRDLKLLAVNNLIHVAMSEAGPTQVGPEVMLALKHEHGIEP